MSSSQTPTQGKKVRTDIGQNIQVYVRVRPLNDDERCSGGSLSSCVVSCNRRDPREVNVQEKPHPYHTKTFSFDRAFSSESRQAEVYKSVAHPLIQQVLRGYNCTVFAYGQTGTGKTFTMEGFKDYSGAWDQDPDAGIIPRSLAAIFDHRDGGGFDPDNFQIKVSFLELYNEEIFDLLAKDFYPDRKYKIFEDSAKKGSVIVQGLEEVVVKSKESVLKILEEGSLKRQTAATKMNATSSRSHTIFTITVVITEKSIVGQEKYIEGKLNLVDLAGSENIGRSGAVDKRAREAGKINESLLTLGRVINSLVKRENHIPYRESKLTRLLQDSLGGRTKTSIIATVSPAMINVEETLSTLDYAHRAKNITNRPEVNQKIPMASKLAEWQAKFDKIKRELEDQRERDGGVFMSNEQKEDMERQVMELVQIRKECRDLSALFDLKTTENDELKDNLEDTIQQLQEKSMILSKTQEEKEVQEFLVSKHREDKVKNLKMTASMIEVADQQYTDLQKLHDVKERKSNVEQHNIKVSTDYQVNSSKRLDKIFRNQEEEIDIAKKFCETARIQREKIVEIFESAGQTTVENVADMDSAVKEKVTNIDSIAASRMHSEQTFLSKTLKMSQANKDDETSKHQNFLTSNLNTAQETQTQVMRRQKQQEDFIDQIKEHEEKSKNSDLSYAQKRQNLNIAMNEKQNEHFATAEGIIQETKKEIKSLSKQKENLNKNMDRMRESIKSQQETLDNFVVMDEELNEKILVLMAKVNEASNELDKSRQVGQSGLKTQAEIEVARRTEMEESETRFKGKLADHEEEMTTMTKQDLETIDSGREEVKEFIEGCQARAQTQYEKMELEFRERSDEVPKVLVDQQELTRDIVKMTSDSRSKIEALTESSRSEARDWSEKASKDTDNVCSNIGSIGANNLEVIDEARAAERKFFTEEQLRDKPTGKTPARAREPAHARQPLDFTPDEERTRRYRTGRDLGAAMRLQIDEEDEDGSGDDSVISGSTNLTESRRTSTDETATNNMRGSVTSLADSEEPGYISDRENTDPKFIKPVVSKLKPPKNYSAAQTRSRSSSRTRNVLTSTN